LPLLHWRYARFIRTGKAAAVAAVAVAVAAAEVRKTVINKVFVIN
jgi:hypothetical protein